MNRYLVSIEKNGDFAHAGVLEGRSSSDMRFYYLPDYLDLRDAAPVSVSLPLREGFFTAEETKCYFDGLLPEGFTRRAIADSMRLSEDDYAPILYALGRECIGAIRISEEKDIYNESYEKLSLEQVRKLAAEGAAKSAEMVLKSHLSLTGASGKVGLYLDRDNNEWYLPHGTAPSTHIVKQSHVRYSGMVINEQLSLMTAAACGIDVPRSFIINTGEGKDGDILFATERFDRTFDGSGRTADGLKCPLRLHQEDFAQALGVPSSRKYEGAGGNYLKDMFGIVRKYASDALKDTLKLWDMISFNILLGNTDAHLKNFSLISAPGLNARHLAPAYDLVSTVVYEESTRNMSFSVGGILSLDGIDEEALKRSAADAGLNEDTALKRFYSLCQMFIPALNSAAEELASSGFVEAERIRDSILEYGVAKRFAGQH